MDPFAPTSSQTETAETPQEAPELSHALAVGALFVLLLAGAVVALPAPVRPPAWSAALFLPFALALVVPRVPNSAALPALCALPVGVMSIHLSAPEMAPLNAGVNQMGWSMLVNSFVTVPALYVLARGPVNRPARLAQFVLLVAAFDQLVALALQFLIPGMLLMALAALLPFTAAAQDASWEAVKDALRHIPKAPLAYLVALVGLVVTPALGLGLAYVLTGGDWTMLVFEPMTQPWSIRASTGGVEHLLRGLFTAAGATLYHRAIR